MSAAVFGLVGVLVGVIANFLVQRTQDRRKFAREDELKFESERLALYRDFLGEAEMVRSLERFEREKLWRFLSEIELLGSRAVFQRAVAAFDFCETFWRFAHSDEETMIAVATSDGKEFPLDRDDLREQLDSLLYRFVRAARKELGVPTDFRPTKVRIGGRISGVPEDVEEFQRLERLEARSWWRRAFHE